MSYLSALRISASALTAERLRMDVTASNIANMETTRTPEGGPYKRQRIVFSAESYRPQALLAAQRGEAAPVTMGVRVSQIYEDPSVRRVYEPTHPDADADGYVSYPDVNLVTEVTNMMSANRAYEANVTAMNAAKSMALKALEIGR